MSAGNLAIAISERGVLPDALLRAGIRRLLRQRLQEVGADDVEISAGRSAAFADSLRAAPIALQTARANTQHYELPAAFFAQVLGARRKYSSAWWPEGVTQLDQAEEQALARTCERAGLADGQRILELGCGWGSLTLWMAERYPHSRILALSNSHSQRVCIEAEAARRGLDNLRVVTGNVTHFDPSAHADPGMDRARAARFDRVVSVEMFEHLRNWPEMFRRIARWLEPDGQFFMHVFAHRGASYAFEERDASDWMTRHFFAGGMMPGDGLAPRFQSDLQLAAHWRWNGQHYARTAEAWLANMDRRREAIWPILERVYGAAQAQAWWVRWRLFFLSCAELFAYRNGQQWFVSHYLFGRQAHVR